MLLDALDARAAAATLRADRRQREHAAAQRGGAARAPIRACACTRSSPTTSAACRALAAAGAASGRLPRQHDRQLRAARTTSTFLRVAWRASCAPGDHLLLGVDLVKPVERLHAAYNDAAGVTAEFNRNVLRVINRELGPTSIRRASITSPSTIPTRRRSRCTCARARRTRCASPALDLTVAFRGRRDDPHREQPQVHARRRPRRCSPAGGFRLEQWYTSPDDAFALALGRRRGRRREARAACAKRA